MAGKAGDGSTGRVKAPEFGVARLTGSVPFLLASVGRRKGAKSVPLGPKRGGPFVPKCPCHRADHAVLAGDSLLQGLARVAQHMPAVEDMHCPGRPPCRTPSP